ncbi:MAG: DUF305 domain-containing protein [Candidatus Methanoperedens sp.]|nr:DUF305 domain-containing protein [Candidatus Methanoperedens sp.]
MLVLTGSETMRNKMITMASIIAVLLVFGTTSAVARHMNDENMIESEVTNAMKGDEMMGDMNHNFDRHFIEQMIPHHKEAILMAEIALQKAEHEEIKQLAEDIITAQTKEINNMRSWYKLWYGTEVPEDSMGMGKSMMGKDGNIERLKNADPFDKEFIEQMIPHHQMAVMMAEHALQRAEHEEIKQLAEDIIASQTKEINDMRSWYKSWYGTEVPEDSMGMGKCMMDEGIDVEHLKHADHKELIEQMISHH